MDEELDFPVDRAGVVERVGDETIDAPDDSDSEAISTMLERDNDDTFETLEDLFASIYGTLDECYIGRKYYDDRGGTVKEMDRDYPYDDRNVSF
ncbi:DUF5789 family protein [Halomicrobium urmianum]|uniref:DUF5789 family protein n=1 Tax=Halomicrobium urmianum TaxID=1586233 RepID=UPI001CDA4724|nr:hypothetical protein [Halomicrobium urmianum]